MTTAQKCTSSFANRRRLPGSFALRENDLLKVLTEAARVCAESLNVPFAKVCRYRAAENDLLIEAGHGWKAGVIGTIESADPSSPQGRA
jgi:hypothetical protein